MTDSQELKMKLLKQFNCIPNDPVGFCRKAYEFLTEEDGEAKEAAEIPVPQVEDDGLYEVRNGEGEVVGIRIKQGSKELVVALHDAANGKEVPLCKERTPEKDNPYITATIDAFADWNGAENTERLKPYLNPNIELEDGWHIPAVGEMLFILAHLKELNEKLVEVGGDPIKQDWYWSSTENSATNAWSLHFGYGNLYNGNKVSYSFYVRPASAFRKASNS